MKSVEQKKATRKGGWESSPTSTRSPSSGPTSRSSVDATLAEAITTLRELERGAFQFSRNSNAGLFFAQQKLVMLRLANGKPPTRDELVRLAGCACSPEITNKLQESAA